MTLLIILAVLLVYGAIGRKLLPFFTEFQVRRIFHKYPHQRYLDSSDQSDVLFFSVVQSAIWPLALIYAGAWQATGVLGGSDPNEDRKTPEQRRQAVIDKRIAKRHASRNGKTHEQLLRENRQMAEQLGLPTDEYS